MARRVSLVLLLGLAGCFEDVEPGASTDGDCTPGEVLCACAPGGECNGELLCVPEGCIPNNCDPGNPMCQCMQPGDACVQGWSCVMGLCHPEMSSTSGMTTTMPPTSSTTASTSTTAAEDTTASMGDTTAVQETSEDSGMPSTTTGPACVAPETCEGCAQCAIADSCTELRDECLDDAVTCGPVLGCLQDCLEGPVMAQMMCFAECDCPSGGMVLVGLVDCVFNICDDACINDLVCE
jgi:hypothetical protein